MIAAIGRILYQFRGFIPIPIFALVFIAARPTPLSFLIGTVVLFVGEAGRVWALTYIGPKSRAERRTRASRLIREGPYSLVRNPLYVANIVIACGILLAANRALFLAGVPVLVLYYIFVIKAEEGFLRATFPDEVDDFFGDVGILFPRLRWPRPAKERFSFLACFIPEINTLVAIEICLGLVGLKLFVDMLTVLDVQDAIFRI